MSAAREDERHLELKVGAIILIALALLVLFVLILGDFSFGRRTTFDVYFQNPGGLTAGAAVKVSGRKMGKIVEMAYLGQDGPKKPTTGESAFVRARVEVNEDVIQSLRDDARFYITTKGVLGDPYLEIAPGVSPQKLDLKQPAFGVDPPRLDLFIADAAELVDGLNRLLDRNSHEIDQVIGSSARLLGAVESLVQREVADTDTSGGPSRFSRMLTSIESLVLETESLVKGARQKYVDDPSVTRTLKNLESLSGKLNREVDPLLAEVKEALGVLDRLGGVIGPAEAKSIQTALGKLDNIAVRAERATVGIEQIVTNLQTGKGTVGALLDDEEIYDDLKELIRDIKRHPWKLVWED